MMQGMDRILVKAIVTITLLMPVSRWDSGPGMCESEQGEKRQDTEGVRERSVVLKYSHSEQEQQSNVPDGLE